MTSRPAASPDSDPARETFPVLRPYDWFDPPRGGIYQTAGYRIFFADLPARGSWCAEWLHSSRLTREDAARLKDPWRSRLAALRPELFLAADAEPARAA
jgi:hypothetical protein